MKYLTVFHNPENKKIIKNSIIKSKGLAVEIGSGEGTLLEDLSKKFSKVKAIDTDFNSLHIAVKKTGHHKNIEYINNDFMRTNFRGASVVIAINSLFEGQYDHIQLSLMKIFNSLKKKGKFIAVFPSMEAYLFLAFLNFYYNSSSEGNQVKVLENTQKEFFEGFDFFGNHRINKKKYKFFYQEELEILFEIIGFQNTKIKKIYFSWDYLKKQGITKINYHKKMWSWFITAEKP